MGIGPSGPDHTLVFGADPLPHALDAMQEVAPVVAQATGAEISHHAAAGRSIRMPLVATSLQRRATVNGASPGSVSGNARANARSIDMPLARQFALAPPGGSPSSQVAQVERVAEPPRAHPDASDPWSPEAAGPTAGLTTVHQTQPAPGGAHAEIDVDDIVERAWGALMSRLATEHERRGFARWA